jgi:DNA-binding transcriptional LysR family regulator
MNLDAVEVFAHVVRAGSFSLAGRQLGMPKSTVSKRIAELEQQLGVSLLKRTTRKLHLTEAGSAYYETCARVLAELKGAETNIKNTQKKPHGLLRISVVVGMSPGHLDDMLSGFLREYEDIEVEIVLTERRVDLVADNIDVVIRVGKLENSSLRSKRLGTSISKLVASPAYLKKNSAPREPLELEQHSFLRCTALPERQEIIELRNGKQRIRVPVKGRYSSNHLTVVRHYAQKGEGIALLPVAITAQDLEGGQLVYVLPDWSTEGKSINLLYADQHFIPSKIQAFVQYATHYKWPAAWRSA